jgi:CHAD domain-containing protein
VAGSVDKGCRVLAARCLRKQTKQLGRQLEGIRSAAADTECVHQARVASRRLRAAMGMFRGCFGAKQVKRWRKAIRRLTSRLGEARDKDVQIEFLYGVLEALEQRACYGGVARLLVKLERQRERIQPRVVEAAQRLRSSGALAEMRALSKRVLSEPGAEEVNLRSPCALARARGHVLDRAERLLAYEDCLADPADRQRHHAMRIAAKRLRYAVEICAPVYGGQLDESLEAIKRVQTLLGEVHDCDFWVEDLERFAAKERKRTKKHYGSAVPFGRLQVGIEYLREDRQRRREQVFGELVDYWRQLVRQRQWERLQETVGGLGMQSAPQELPIEDTSDHAVEPTAGRSGSNGQAAGQGVGHGPHSGIERRDEPKRQREDSVRMPAG